MKPVVVPPVVGSENQVWIVLLVTDYMKGSPSSTGLLFPRRLGGRIWLGHNTSNVSITDKLSAIETLTGEKRRSNDN